MIETEADGQWALSQPAAAEGSFSLHTLITLSTGKANRGTEIIPPRGASFLPAAGLSPLPRSPHNAHNRATRSAAPHGKPHSSKTDLYYRTDRCKDRRPPPHQAHGKAT